MMRNFTFIIPLGLIVCANARKLATNHVGEAEASLDELVGKFFDKLVQKLFNNALKVSPLQQIDLGSVTLVKTSNLENRPRKKSSSKPHPSSGESASSLPPEPKVLHVSTPREATPDQQGQFDPVTSRVDANPAQPEGLSGRRLPRGVSDELQVNCSCPASSGVACLFHVYVDLGNTGAEDFYKKQVALGEALSPYISGKVRVATEGVSGTVAGDPEFISRYCDAVRSDLKKPQLDFKPEPGCVHLHNGFSVRRVEEVIPLGVKDFTLSQGVIVGEVPKLSPQEWHNRLTSTASCANSSVIVLDVRNWYESRVGHFVPSRGCASLLRAPIRRYGQLPEYLNKESTRKNLNGKTVLMYCTGGVRCEKAAVLLRRMGITQDVYQLEGGIAAYARAFPQKTVEDASSLYRGLNFVFDGRGAIRMSHDVMTWCDGCGVSCDRLGKCRSSGCHMILVVCEACEVGDRESKDNFGSPKVPGVACCKLCDDQSEAVRTNQVKRRPCLCECEDARVERLMPRPPTSLRPN